jgi:hypothetical protein
MIDPAALQIVLSVLIGWLGRRERGRRSKARSRTQGIESGRLNVAGLVT